MPYQPTHKGPNQAQVLAVIRSEEKSAVEETARYVRSKAAKYPPKADSSSYVRTGTLGRNITYRQPAVRGKRIVGEVGVNLGTVPYARYVEEGTGIYGPAGQPIRPVKAKVLAWKAGGQWIIARQVRGMKPWHYMRKAFTDPASSGYFERRIRQALARIKQRLDALV